MNIYFGRTIGENGWMKAAYSKSNNIFYFFFYFSYLLMKLELFNYLCENKINIDDLIIIMV